MRRSLVPRQVGRQEAATARPHPTTTRGTRGAAKNPGKTYVLGTAGHQPTIIDAIAASEIARYRSLAIRCISPTSGAQHQHEPDDERDEEERR
jgi:hypothetical protein